MYLILWKAKRNRELRKPYSICYSDERRTLIEKCRTQNETLLRAYSWTAEARTSVEWSLAYAKEQCGDAKGALTIYCSIIEAQHNVVDLAYAIFRASVLLVHLRVFDEALRYLEYIEDEPLHVRLHAIFICICVTAHCFARPMVMNLFM